MDGRCLAATAPAVIFLDMRMSKLVLDFLFFKQ